MRSWGGGERATRAISIPGELIALPHLDMVYIHKGDQVHSIINVTRGMNIAYSEWKTGKFSVLKVS